MTKHEKIRHHYPCTKKYFIRDRHNTRCNSYKRNKVNMEKLEKKRKISLWG